MTGDQTSAPSGGPVAIGGDCCIETSFSRCDREKRSAPFDARENWSRCADGPLPRCLNAGSFMELLLTPSLSAQVSQSNWWSRTPGENVMLRGASHDQCWKQWRPGAQEKVGVNERGKGIEIITQFFLLQREPL